MKYSEAAHGNAVFPNPISAQIWDMKYRLQDPEVSGAEGEVIERKIQDLTVQDTWARVAKNLASVEGENIRSETEEQFYSALENFKFLPAGRITAGAGTGRNVTLFNCFVMGTIPDDMGGIFDMIKEAALTMQQGGGIGYDFSTLRPAGAPVIGVGSDASGPLSFMDVWDAMCRTIMSAGSRRGAMMAVMQCDHPDIEKFIDAKHDSSKLRMFNLSVTVTDNFMQAVKDNADWHLMWKGEVWKTLRARDLWNKIMQSTYDYAEPGVIFIDRINNMNPLKYVETIAATNPCVPAGTPILTREGWQEIDLLVGKPVEVWNGFEWSKTTPRITGHDQPMTTVTLSNGRSLTCTTAHKFVLKDGTRVAAADLPIGAHLLKHKWPVVHGGVVQENAYQQGFFSGDGWIGRRGEHYIGLYGEKRALVDAFEGEARTYPLSGGYVGTDLTQDRIYVRFNGESYLPKTFVPEGDWSVQSRLDWLSGLIDADGCAYRSDNSVSVQVSSKDRSFLDNAQLLLNTLGVSGQLSPMKDCWRLTISANAIRDLSNLGLVTKRIVLDDNNPQREASRFVKVVSVEARSQSEDTVYCFTENERHLGCFDGVLTGQCGEQALPPYGACLLGSINLARLIADPFRDAATMDEDEMERLVAQAVRMMDNVVDVSNFPLPEQKAEAEAKRRIGLGVTGLADALLMLGLRYGSEEAAEQTELWMKKIAHAAMRASIELAKEKGPFPLFDADLFLESPFIQQYDDDIKADIREYGVRNALLTSIAPTGTISLYAGNVSSGIEPVFAYSYTRKVLQKDGSRTEEEVVDYAVQMYRDIFGISDDADLPEYFVSAQTLTPTEHVRMQAAAQKWIDNCISKTINCPEDISFDDFKQVYLDAWDQGCKGCTTYRPNDVTGSVLSVEPKAKEEAPAVSLPANGIVPMPRTEALEGATYKLKWPALEHAFYVTINDIIDEHGTKRPFEIFINTKNAAVQASIAALTLMISAVFRRGGDVSFVAEEMRGVIDAQGGSFMKGRYCTSLYAAIGDVLLEHMKEIGFIETVAPSVAPKAEALAAAEVTAPSEEAPKLGKQREGCPDFGNCEIVYSDGCENCKTCLWSRCG